MMGVVYRAQDPDLGARWPLKTSSHRGGALPLDDVALESFDHASSLRVPPPADGPLSHPADRRRPPNAPVATRDALRRNIALEFLEAHCSPRSGWNREGRLSPFAEPFASLARLPPEGPANHRALAWHRGTADISPRTSCC